MQADFLSNNIMKNKQTEEPSGSSFASMLDALNETQNSAQNSVYNLITTGEGDLAQVLIELQQAESKMRTVSVIRDNVIENYKQLINTQV